VSEVLAVMRGNAALAQGALAKLAAALPKTRAASPIDSTLDHAIVTPRDQWSAHRAARLDAVAERLLRKDDKAPAKQN
jgi:5'-methylthioadenosine phosphorylase